MRSAKIGPGLRSVMQERFHFLYPAKYTEAHACLFFACSAKSFAFLKLQYRSARPKRFAG